MAITHGDLIEGLEARGQTYLIQHLNTLGVAAASLTPCNALLTSVDDFITAINGTGDETVLNALLDGRLHAGVPTHAAALDNAAWKKLKISAMIDIARKDLGMGEELKGLFSVILTDAALKEIIKKLLPGTATQPDITLLVKEVNEVIAAEATGAGTSATKIRNALFATHGAISTAKQFFANLGDTPDLAGMDGAFNGDAAVFSARLAVLKNGINELTGAKPTNFIALLNSKLADIKIPSDYKLVDFQKKLFDQLSASTQINNSPAAFIEVLNTVLGLAAGTGAAITNATPNIQDVINEIKDHTKQILTQGQIRYLDFISSPQVRQQPQLLAILQKPELVKLLVAKWALNPPPADLVEQINAALEDKVPAIAGSPDTARQALALQLLGAANALDSLVPIDIPARLGLKNVGDQTKLVREAKHFHDLNLPANKNILASSPAFTNMLVELTVLQAPTAAQPDDFEKLRAGINFTVINNVDLINKDVNDARVELVDNFFNTPQANHPAVRAVLLDATKITDPFIHQTIGEARLKSYLGDTFTQLFSSDSPVIFNDYINLCRKYGKMSSNAWQMSLEKDMKAVVSTGVVAPVAPVVPPAPAGDDYKKLLTGYLRIREVYGQDFLDSFPAKQLKEAAAIAGGRAVADWRKNLVDLQNDLINKDASGFRATIGNAASAKNLLPSAPLNTEINDNAAYREIGILRIQKALDKNIIAALRNTANNPSLFDKLIGIAVNERLWEAKLNQIATFIKQAAEIEKRGEAITQLEANLKPYYGQLNPSSAAKIIGHYQFEKLKGALRAQGLTEFASRIDYLTDAGVNDIQVYLAQNPLPKDLTAKIHLLEKEHAGKLLPLAGDAPVLKNSDPELRQSFKNF